MTVQEQIEGWVNLTPNSFKVKTIVDNGNGTATVNVCNTAWAMVHKKITMSGTEYKIVSIVRDTSITVTGLPSGDSYSVSIPFFTYGTPKQVDVEREFKREGGTKVTPMIYLFAPVTETKNHNPLSPIDKTINFVMSVLADYEDDSFTEEIVEYSVKAMRKLSDSIIDTIKKQIGEVDPDTITQTVKEYPKYAQYFDKSGATKNIFSEKLSGVENNLTISLKIKDNCVNLCNY